MAKSNYKNKPFSEWTEEDFQQHQADVLAAYAKTSEEDARMVKEHLRAEREAAEKQEG